MYNTKVLTSILCEIRHKLKSDITDPTDLNVLRDALIDMGKDANAAQLARDTLDCAMYGVVVWHKWMHYYKLLEASHKGYTYNSFCRELTEHGYSSMPDSITRLSSTHRGKALIDILDYTAITIFYRDDIDAYHDWEQGDKRVMYLTTGKVSELMNRLETEQHNNVDSIIRILLKITD